VSRDTQLFIGAAGLFATLAAITSLELDNDSYEHFTTSVQVLQSGNVHDLVLDLWNKPLPGLLYGLPGLAGILWARLTSVLVTLGLVWCVRDVWRHIARDSAVPTAVILVAVVFQTAVLNQTYVTMTELPAALALAAGLSFYVRGRDRAACLAWGFAPLARLEVIAIVAASIALVNVSALRQGWSERRAAAGRMLLGALPCAIWWAAGTWMSGNWRWMSDDSYAHLRNLDLSVLTINAFGGLPGALSLPMIFLGVFGLLNLGRVTTLFRGRSPFTLVAAWLAIHLAFMTAMVIYPLEIYGGLGIAAVNGRNYNVLTPALALLVIAGIETWGARLVSPALRSETKTHAWIAFAVAVTAGIEFFFMQRVMDVSLFGASYKLALGLAVLAAFLAVSWLVARGQLGERPQSTWRSVLLVGLALATVAASPLFWYPLRSHDQRSLALDEFCSLARRTPPPARIVQDLSGGLETYCSLDATVRATWIWPTQMVDELAKVEPGSWLLVETDQDGALKSRYSDDLSELIGAGQRVREVARHQAFAQPRWQQLLDRVNYRNPPVGWTLYEWAGVPSQ
jgi:hypothetical protein